MATKQINRETELVAVLVPKKVKARQARSRPAAGNQAYLEPTATGGADEPAGLEPFFEKTELALRTSPAA